MRLGGWRCESLAFAASSRLASLFDVGGAGDFQSCALNYGNCRESVTHGLPRLGSDPTFTSPMFEPLPLITAKLEHPDVVINQIG